VIGPLLEELIERSRGKIRARFAPAVEAALSSGWTPTELAAFADLNAGGVHSPNAVLAARLSPTELPAPRSRSVRPAFLVRRV